MLAHDGKLRSLIPLSVDSCYFVVCCDRDSGDGSVCVCLKVCVFVCTCVCVSPFQLGIPCSVIIVSYIKTNSSGLKI